MPATVHRDPLRVECVFPGGEHTTLLIGRLPNRRLAEDLALGLASRVHPHGTIGTPRTATVYTVHLRHLVRALSAEGFAGGVADLTRAQMVRYWLANTFDREMYTRKLLLGFDAATGAIAPQLRTYLEGRSLKQRPRTSQYLPYAEGEWQRLTDGLREAVNLAWKEHQRALTLAESHTFRDGNDAHVTRALVEHGPMTTATFCDYAGIPLDTAPPVAQWCERIYPSASLALAHRLLFGVYSGIVPDGIAGLGLDDLQWSGDSNVLLSYIKRRTGPESANLPRRAVRVLERWLELSAPLRRLAPADVRGELWICLRRKSASRYARFEVSDLRSQKMVNNARAKLSAQMAVPDDNGEPLKIHAARIRTTYHQQLGSRGWTGRVTIDPNHTPRVEGDRYLSATTPAHKENVEAIIEDAQADVRRRSVPPVVLGAAETARFAEEQPETARRLGVETGVLAELLTGEQDVFTAACSDLFSGLHGPKGKPCPARPWVCLLCPLAVFMPRHVPNLLRLRAYFARQSRSMTTDQFLAVFGPYADRLDREVLTRFDARVLDQAAAQVADTDAEIPLRPEEVTA